MRAGIITFLHNENYGSTLQAWALQQALLAMGVDATHIDYHPDSKEKLRNLITSGNSPKLLLDGFSKRRVKASQNGAREKSAAFRAFQREQLRMTAPCRDHKALETAAAGYDVLISGSDQIWSPVWFNPAYYLDFAGAARRVAYAPSLGVSSIVNPAKAKRIRRLAAQYDALSVREKEGAEEISRLTGKPVPVMPDPVCLIPGEEWKALAEPPVTDRPYLACYFIGDQPAYWEKARALAAEKGLEIRVIPVTESAYAQGLTLEEGLSPQRWLGVLAGAAHVLTDSFHGTVFSALLGSDFTVMRRYRDGDPESKNSRIDQLFRELGISGQEEQIPWAQVECRLQEMRCRGLAWLKDAVGMGQETKK